MVTSALLGKVPRPSGKQRNPWMEGAKWLKAATPRSLSHSQLQWLRYVTANADDGSGIPEFGHQLSVKLFWRAFLDGNESQMHANLKLCYEMLEKFEEEQYLGRAITLRDIALMEATLGNYDDAYLCLDEAETCHENDERNKPSDATLRPAGKAVDELKLTYAFRCMVNIQAGDRPRGAEADLVAFLLQESVLYNPHARLRIATYMQQNMSPSFDRLMINLHRLNLGLRLKRSSKIREAALGIAVDSGLLGAKAGIDASLRITRTGWNKVRKEKLLAA